MEVTCVPSTPGTLQVGVSMTDQDGLSYVSDPSATVRVESDPTVSALSVSAAPSYVGEQVYLSVVAQGGYGNLTALWRGLPGGCSTSGFTAVCVPTTAGNYTVDVLAEDSNGFVAGSPALIVRVLPSAGSGGGSFFGGEGSMIIIGVVAVAIVGCAVGMWVWRRRRLDSTE